MEKVGLFGGSFNPIHHGHLIVVRAVAERVGLSRVIFLPCGQPPHKDEDDLLDGTHRSEMVKLAIAGGGTSKLACQTALRSIFSFSDYDMTRPGPTFTIDTVRHFRAELGIDAELNWIIGADSLRELPTWRCVTELVEECRIITAARRPYGKQGLSLSSVWDELRHTFSNDQIARLRSGIVETPMIDISATDIRQRISAGRSVRYLLPEPVVDYMVRNRLL